MRFDKPKGQRLHRYFHGIVNHDGLWWVPDLNKWVPYSETKGKAAGNWCSCRTLRAFKRHLRKHPEIKGKAILVSRYIGFDVYS